ncbi:hypothetical protein HNP55_003567 [Paucibacter oligotrophus]|uniref:ASCH domain-containing protein n=1 Tax=Roseateles oligotrophus TaxID=1769250 RepID=A0A840LBB4_9BURK|nr:hypothetical protein [Roseateles oligotrophus]
MDLTLPLKAEYFDAIKNGTKVEEYRLCSPHWRRRLEHRTFDRVVLTLGYPRKGDESRRLVLPWRGMRVTTITHSHFGPAPVLVYAIRVAPETPLNPDDDYSHAAEDSANKRSLEVRRARGQAWPFPF